MNNIIIKTNRWLIALIVLVLFYSPYFFANHIAGNHFRIPFVLGEENIPFIPWTSVVYLSLFVQGFVVVHWMEKSVLPNVVKIMGIVVLVDFIVFLVFPTEYPRECYPNTNPFLCFVRCTDTAANCTPSLHVGTTLIFAACYQHMRNSKLSKILFWGWSLAIIVSTLTTKQHYMLDILAATIITGVILYVARKKLRPRGYNP